MTEKNKIINPVNLYGSIAAVGKKKNVKKHEGFALMGQVHDLMTNPLVMGVLFDEKFTRKLEGAVGLPDLGLYQGRHSQFWLYDLSLEVSAVKDGNGGATLLMQINGELSDPELKFTRWKGKLRHYEFDLEATAKLRVDHNEPFTEVSHQGRCIIEGPDYVLAGLIAVMEGTKRNPQLETMYKKKLGPERIEEIVDKLSNCSIQLATKAQYVFMGF